MTNRPLTWEEDFRENQLEMAEITASLHPLPSTSAANESPTPSAAPSSIGMGSSANLAAPPAIIDSNSTTSPSALKAEDTAATTSSRCASAATEASTTDSSTSSTSSGDPASGASSAAVWLGRVDKVEYGEGQVCHVGDALEKLRELPDNCVQTIVTSPPYYQLRRYMAPGSRGAEKEVGREPTLEAYVDNLVEVFREARRVLRPDGTMWIVMGDSYASSGGIGRQGRNTQMPHRSATAARMKPDTQRPALGFKPKDLMMVPARLAIALCNDGWFLRSEIIWQKGNPVPSSVMDRPTRSHETVFMFAKSRRYYYDRYSLMEPSTSNSSDRKKMAEMKDRLTAKHLEPDGDDPVNAANSKSNLGRKRSVGQPGMRNGRSVWTLATEPFKGKHFATMPTKLVARIIEASTSHWACLVCGAPYRRVVRKVAAEGRGSGQDERKFRGEHGAERGMPNDHMGFGVPWRPSGIETVGWESACGHLHKAPPSKCVVLDPFAGALTASVVADRLGRAFVGIDLNPAFVRLGVERVEQDRFKRQRAARKRT